MTRRRARERALDRHEVGAGLRQRGSAVAQHRRRMQRRDEHRVVAERELSAAQLGDALLGLEQQLGGEVAERDDDRGSMKLELRLEVRPAGLDLDRLRVAVARRAALHHVGDVHVVAGEADALDQLVSSCPARPDERLALQVLLLARALADEHQVRVRLADAEHHLGAGLGQRAQRARERLAFEVGERGERRWFEQRHGRTRTRQPVVARWYATASRIASAVTSATSTAQAVEVAPRPRRSRGEREIAVEAGVRRADGAGQTVVRARGRRDGTRPCPARRRSRRPRASCSSPVLEAARSPGTPGRRRGAAEPATTVPSSPITSPTALTTASAPTSTSPSRADARAEAPGAAVLAAPPLPDASRPARRRPARSRSAPRRVRARPRARRGPRRRRAASPPRATRSKIAAAGTIGTGPPAVGNPRPCSASAASRRRRSRGRTPSPRRAPPRRPARPWPRVEHRGLAVAGAPPRTSPDPTVPGREQHDGHAGAAAGPVPGPSPPFRLRLRVCGQDGRDSDLGDRVRPVLVVAGSLNTGHE